MVQTETHKETERALCSGTPTCGPSFCEAAVLPFTMLPVYLIYQVILSLGLCDVQANFSTQVQILQGDNIVTSSLMSVLPCNCL